MRRYRTHANPEDDGDGDVVSLAEHRFSKLVQDATEGGDDVRVQILELLLRLGFPPSYADAAAADLAEGWMNDDVAPLWMSPAFEAPEPGDIESYLRKHGLFLQRGWVSRS